MRDDAVRGVLGSIRAAMKQLALYPAEHPATVQILKEAAVAANEFAREHAGEISLSIIGDSLYQDRTALPHPSLEFNGLLRDLQARGVDSVTFESPVSAGDIFDLASLAAGLSGDLPADGTIRLNERPYSRTDLEPESGVAGLRKGYARSLDVLRGVSMAVTADQEFDLTGATWVVEQLVEQTLAHPAASVLLSSMKSHDEYTFYHSVNVCILSIALAQLVGLPGEHVKLLAIGALLHDIGKTRVSVSTLQFPGRLDSEQWAEIKLHPQEGAAAILGAAAPGQEIAAVVAFEHHARFDGQGYPSLVYRRPVHFFSRLVSTADTYDALTTRRSYRRPETPNRALRILLEGAGSHYDPEVVQAFIKMVGVYPAGSLLELENGEMVMVVDNSQEPGRPPAAVLVRDRSGVYPAELDRIDLESRQIIDQLSPERAGVEPAALLEQVGFAEG